MKTKILNTELEIDFYDADMMEKIEESFANTQKNIEKYKKSQDLKSSEIIRKTCKIIFEFFNTIFGEGTDKKIFGNRTNLRICMQAFDEFVKIKKQQDEELEEISKKYSPNRATRRTKK